jgi:photosystem II CP47 chlorophyll apoprotein
MVTNYSYVVCQLSETFPVVLLDKDGLYVQTYRSVVESKYSIEQVGVSITFYGGELDGVSLTTQQQLKNMRVVHN